MGANNLMDAANVDQADPQIAHSDCVMAVLEIPMEAAARAMELGKKHGVRTILNPAPAAPLPDSIFRNVDILTPNESELRIIMGLRPDDPTPNAELAAQLKARGVQTLIVTLGGRGALVYSDDDVVEIPSIPVDIVDTTGAGDAFNSGLSVALSEGHPLIEAVRYGCVTGALACTKLGVIPSLTTREVADRIFAQYH
jgi:ribokinase